MSAFPPPMSAEEYRLLNELISDLIGIHFAESKTSILESRLRPRLQTLRLGRFMDYYLLLQYELDSELDYLTHAVTNNETYFFRETHQFEALFEDALDQLPEAVRRSRGLEVLCAGCSSGEEPYTLAIFAGEYPGRLEPGKLAIQAFDIDRERLALARRAEFGPNSLRAASEEQIRRHFQRVGTDLYSLQSRYREGVRFASGNILDRRSYPSRGPYDVVFCRNVLIYFSEAALRRAIDNFAAILKPGGLLFLGHAESIIGMSRQFETVRLKRCIAYRRI